MRKVARGASGVVVGYVATAALAALTTRLLRSQWPVLGTAGQAPVLEVLDFAYAVAYMAVGGFLAQKVGGATAPLVLGALFVVLGLATAMLGIDRDHSSLYVWLLPVAAGVAVMLGARLAGGRGAPSV